MNSHGSLLPHPTPCPPHPPTARWGNKKRANLQECDWSSGVMCLPPGQSVRAGRWDVIIGPVWRSSLLPSLSLWPEGRRRQLLLGQHGCRQGLEQFPPKNEGCCPLKKGSYSFHISVKTCNASTSLKSLRGLPWWPSGEESAASAGGMGLILAPGSSYMPRGN